MQGIFVNGERPASKKAVREAVAADPSSVQVEATSMFGNEYDGLVSGMSDGAKVTFVGPDPYRRRTFYGTIVRSNGSFRVR